MNRHRSANTIICVKDPYNHPHSIKDEERELRRKGIGQIPNVFMKKKDVFPNTKDLKVIMVGNENKEFMNAAKNKKVFWSVGPTCEDQRQQRKDN